MLSKLFSVFFAVFQCCSNTQDDANSLIIDGCSFENIECWIDGSCIVFNDDLDFCDISVGSTTLTDCDAAFYASNHGSHSYIDIHSVFVITGKLWNVRDHAVFQFADADSVWFNIHFSIENI